MNLAIISDTHLGDPLCSLVEKNGENYSAGPKYEEFLQVAGNNNDYLILLGDILDFSVTSYENAYRAGKAFFSLIQKDKVAEQFIYVPGNHDYDIWNIVENEVNIIHQIKNGKTPRKFRTAVPGILDDRAGSGNRGFILPGVGKREDGNYIYGGLFLDHITKDFDKETLSSKGEDCHFVFAYPNLYLVTDTDSILMTHGQYLESYWSLLSKWAPIIFGSDLKLGDKMDIKEMVGMNFPFNQLACSGVGQAGILSDLLSDIQKQIKMGVITKSKQYLDNLDNYLDDNVFVYTKWYQFINEAASDLISNKIKSLLTQTISEQADSRYTEQDFNKPELKKRFFDYYNASLAEIEELGESDIHLPIPKSVIFGHTHIPIAWGEANKISTTAGTALNLYNTGGWIWKLEGDKKSFCGAEVFKYETGKGFWSAAVR